MHTLYQNKDLCTGMCANAKFDDDLSFLFVALELKSVIPPCERFPGSASEL